MTEITIIGILHQEKLNPNITSDLVCEIVKKINPDALLVECAIDQYDRWKDNILNYPTDEYIEPNFFRKYLAGKNIPILPFDMAGKPEIYNREYFDTISMIEKDIEKIRLLDDYKNNKYIKWYFDLMEIEDESIKTISLRQINSIKQRITDDYWVELSIKYIEPILIYVYPKYAKFIEKFTLYDQRRDKEMAENIVLQSKGYSKTVALVGSGHKYGILKNIEIMEGDYCIKEYWEY